MVTSDVPRDYWRIAKRLLVLSLSLVIPAAVAILLVLEFVKPPLAISPPRIDSTAADSQEPDDSPSTATLLEIGGPPQSRTLHTRRDEDWYVVKVVDGEADIFVSSKSEIGFEWFHENATDGIVSTGLSPEDMDNGGYASMIPFEIARNWENERIYLKVLNPRPGTVSYRIVASEASPIGDWLADLRTLRDDFLMWFESPNDEDTVASTPPDYGTVDAAAREILPDSFSWVEMEDLGLPREAVDTLVAVPYRPPTDYRISKSFDRGEAVFSQLELVPADGIVWIAVETSQGATVGDLSLEWTGDGWEFYGSSWGGQDDDELFGAAEAKLRTALGGSLDETRVVEAQNGTWLLAQRGTAESGVLVLEMCHDVDYPAPPNPGPWTGVSLRRWFE